MGKRGRSQKGGGNRFPKKVAKAVDDYVDPNDMDDEIDAFHKQRDMVPLDVNADSADESDEDDVEPVFGDEDIDDDDDDDDEDEAEDEDEEEEEEEEEEKGLAAKIIKQQKYLRSKIGGVDDEMEEAEPEEEKRLGWGGIKPRYHGGDNRDFEIKSSDDEAPKEEEDEVLRLQKENAKILSNEDFGLDDSDGELTLEEISVKGKKMAKPTSKDAVVDDTGAIFEISKDLDALPKEDQMNVVYSSAPELVGLLDELNASVEELESKLNPLLNKVKANGINLEGGLRYLEMKQLLLLAYCQAISFYLLLKSEGHSVRDHPVIARLVEIKELLNQTKDLDKNLPSNLEELLRKNTKNETAAHLVPKDAVNKARELFGISYNSAEQVQKVSKKQLENDNIFSNAGNKEQDTKHKNDPVGVESKEMLRIRAALESKLRSTGIISGSAPKSDKSQKNLKPVNGHLETYDDFDDDAPVSEKDRRGLSNGSAASTKLSQLIPTRKNKPKVISGDDDLPKRDDIGERRRKHELRVLAGAGVKSVEVDGNELGPVNESDGTGEEDMETEDNGEESEGSEDDFYAQVQQKRAAKVSAKAEMYKRDAPVPSLPETADGKRLISRQIEKNRGLTRPRNKDKKNPRKNYKNKHDKKEKRRKGQFQGVKKPYGNYGGETTGINAGVSRSVRF